MCGIIVSLEINKIYYLKIKWSNFLNLARRPLEQVVLGIETRTKKKKRHLNNCKDTPNKRRILRRRKLSDLKRWIKTTRDYCRGKKTIANV